MNIMTRLFGKSGSTAVVRQASDFLHEADRSRAFIRARSIDAALIHSHLDWHAVAPGVVMTAMFGVTFVRSYLAADGEYWGYADLNSRRLPLECEEQMLAYLIARQDVRSRASHEVPALLTFGG